MRSVCSATPPAAMNGYLCLHAAPSDGVLSTKMRAQIALAVSEINCCTYCVSTYTVSGRRAGMSSAEIGAARFGSGSDKKSDAVLDLVWAILTDKGQIADSDFEPARNAGLSDEEIVEVVANIALTTFTNFVIEVATTAIDFPEVRRCFPCHGRTARLFRRRSWHIWLAKYSLMKSQNKIFSATVPTQV